MVRVTLVPMRTVLVVRSSEDEATAWAAVLDSDSDAFVAIFDKHRDRVYRHALRITENVHDAEDVTAGAFLELWRRQKAVRVVDGSVLPWLLVTTTNLARNLARSLRRYRSILAAPTSDPWAPEQLPPPGSSRSSCSSTSHTPKRPSHSVFPMGRYERGFIVREPV